MRVVQVAQLLSELGRSSTVELEPVPDEPVLMADDALVVADLHIGLEEELREKGVHIPSRAEAMGRKLAEIASRRGASRIIILGDVKHLVPKMASRERRDVYVFFRDLASVFREIYIAQGNHDGMLKHIVPRNVRFKPAYGFRLDDTGFCHGHACPCMTDELGSWAHCSTRSSSGSTMPLSIYSTEPTWAGSATSESIWDSGRKIIGSEAADALEVEARIAARRGDGKSHPCLGRPLPTSSGGRRRIPGGDPDGPLVRNDRASS